MALILAAGTTAATSSDVVVAADTVANLVAFTVAPEKWFDTLLRVFVDTDGDDQFVCVLSAQRPSVTVQGPGTYRVARTGGGQSAVGVSAP